jgi:LmbE family N-acetylglucosaminyl deacetylase
MPRGLIDYMRRKLRGWTWARCCPVLLPHFEVQDKGVRVLGKRFEPLSASLAAALRLCDGKVTLKEVSRRARVPRDELIHQHDDGRLVMWSREIAPQPPADATVDDIIVAPHPDDAPLSAFGAVQGDSWLFDEAGRSLVLDIFTRTSWSRFPELLRSAAEVQQVRCAEERLMARLLGARLKMLDLPEAVLRGCAIEEVFTAPPTAGDAPIIDAIRAAVTALAGEHASARWYLPLGVGGHLDHRLARDAALAALEAAGLPRERIFFYEDLPYAVAEPTRDFAATVPGRRLAPSSHRPGVWALFNKREALRVYWSQLTWPQIREVTQYTNRRGGGNSPPMEQYWQLCE